MRRRHLVLSVILLLAPLTVGAAPPAWSDDEAASDEEQDHERARVAVERGEALPLEQVLAAVRARTDGQIIGVEFENENGVWIYEFRVVDAAGHVVEILADARTARIIGVEGD